MQPPVTGQYCGQVNLLFRTIAQWFRSRRAPALLPHDVGRTPFRVLPTDLDVLGHMNNGIYFSIMDLGRMDLMIRAGMWAKLIEKGFYPVAASETIAFRKSLRPWQRFILETRVIGYDAKAVFVEQRFVVKGEVYARGYMRGCFRKKTGGTVGIEELTELLGIDAAEVTLPKWLATWSGDVALPPTRGLAPSEW